MGQSFTVLDVDGITSTEVRNIENYDRGFLCVILCSSPLSLSNIIDLSPLCSVHVVGQHQLCHISCLWIVYKKLFLYPWCPFCCWNLIALPISKMIEALWCSAMYRLFMYIWCQICLLSAFIWNMNKMSLITRLFFVCFYNWIGTADVGTSYL